MVNVCSFDLCIPGKVDEAGAAKVQNTLTGPGLRRPALTIGDGRSFLEIAYPLADAADQALGPVVAIRLPPVAQGVPIVTGGSTTAGGVTLVTASDTRVDHDELSYAPDQRGLRAVTLAEVPAAIDPAEHLELIVGLAPQGTTFCPAASASFPNSRGWPAGTDVEILVQGVDLEQRFAPYGGWAKVSNARVTADGKAIVTSPGEGLPVLTVVGLRR